MFKILKKEGSARRGEFETVHGTIRTPVFMNVGTAAAIKGGLDSFDLKEIGCTCAPATALSGKWADCTSL